MSQGFLSGPGGTRLGFWHGSVFLRVIRLGCLYTLFKSSLRNQMPLITEEYLPYVAVLSEMANIK